MKKTKRTTKFLTNLFIIVSILLLGTGLFADFTPLINYQGKLQENNVPVNETLNMEFKIFDSLSGGNQLWSSGVVSVSVNNGIFNYILGMNNGAAFALIDWSRDRWIEVVIDGETLAPREQLTGVPYSLMSRDLVLTNNKTIKNTWVTNSYQIKGTAILGTTLPGLHAHSHSPGQSDALEANSIVASNIVNGTITDNKLSTTVGSNDGDILKLPIGSDGDILERQSGIWTAITPGGSAETLEVPLGGVIAWLKSITGTTNLPVNFVECNGQTLNDIESPYNGQVIPDLNGFQSGNTNRFLTGGGIGDGSTPTVSGITGGSKTHTHIIDPPITTTSTVNGGGPTDHSDVWTVDTYKTSSHSHTVDISQFTSGVASSLPSFYKVVWIMRVK